MSDTHPARPLTPRPAPRLTSQTAAYWKAARAGRLLLGDCAACGKLSHPPQTVCPFCWTAGLGSRAASGRATLNSFTVVHQSGVPALRERLPYVVAYVELEEGVCLLSNLVTCAPGAARIGMALRVLFEPINDESAAVLFEPA
jgi:uncharacterized OB-fold protein